MFPLSDPDIPRQTRPILTIGLIITNVLVFAYQFFLNDIDTFILPINSGQFLRKSWVIDTWKLSR